MNDEHELLEYINEIKSFINKFVKGSEVFLPTEEQANFKQKIFEIKDLLDRIFGKNNFYTNNVLHTVNLGSGGFFGGPSVACVHEVVAILKAAHKKYLKESENAIDTSRNEIVKFYIDEKRIYDLKNIKNKNFDLKRIIKLSEEINSANHSESYLSIIMLLRAIIDHIPPIFNMKSFMEVANNHGGKSFKELMIRLEITSRKLADYYLHKQIQSKEDLPNYTQINFTNELDLLLSEIIKKLK